MTITSVEPFCLRVGEQAATDGSLPYEVSNVRGTIYSRARESVWVKITTAGGSVGWGEALVPVSPAAVAALITDLLKPLLVGRDASDIRSLRMQMIALMRERGHAGGHQADALAGTDLALWDVVGQHHRLSVSQMLGGAVRHVIPTYCSSLGGPVAEALPRRLDEGYVRFKLHADGPVGEVLDMLEDARAIAPNALIAFDGHCAYSLNEAIQLGRGLDRLGIWFFESPLPPEDLAGHRRLRDSIDTPLAVGEAWRHRYEVAEWVEAGAFDFGQPDVCRVGLTEGLAIGILVASAHGAILPHHSAAFGPGLAAGLHLAASAEVMPALEMQDPAARIMKEFVCEPLEIEAGQVRVPTAPGLGLLIDEDKVRRSAVAR